MSQNAQNGQGDNSANSAVAVAEKCMFRPTIEEIMAAIFSKYNFALDSNPMLPSEVFAADSFLPLFSSIAISRAESIFGFPFYIEEIEDENALFGMTIAPEFPSAAPFLIYTLQMMNVATDIFGRVPCKIELDELYAWATSRELQEAGLPYLGIKH